MNMNRCCRLHKELNGGCCGRLEGDSQFNHTLPATLFDKLLAHTSPFVKEEPQKAVSQVPLEGLCEAVLAEGEVRSFPRGVVGDQSFRKVPLQGCWNRESDTKIQQIFGEERDEIVFLAHNTAA